MTKYLIILLLYFFTYCAATESEPKEVYNYLTEGKASWYGRKFQGKYTASGEVFDTAGLTAAHRTLPFGTILKVTNKTNGKSVVVKVNDRGPVNKTRILDLSKQAAKELGMIHAGVANVILEEKQILISDKKEE
jgi:rare lipoprotein A